MKTIQIMLAIALMTFTSLHCVNTVPEATKIEVINTVKENQITIANISIKGITYYFLLDPDSRYSFIDSTFVQEKNIPVLLVKQKSSFLPSYIISPKTVDIMGVKLYVKDFSVTIESVEKHTGKRLSGVLGSDVIFSTQSTINFRKDIYERLTASK